MIRIIFILCMTISTVGHTGGPDVDWMLNCQGCHKPDASGVEGQVPDMNGFIAQFLSVKGGRDYLSQVPGVAFSALSDRDMAELLNWLLVKYDPEHLPKDFKPYDEKEVSKLRAKPLITGAGKRRKELLDVMASK